MFSKLLKIFILFQILFLFLPNPVKAVTIEIANYPTTIDSGTFQVEAKISGAGDGTNYLRVDLYKDGTSNYFGETYNGSDWYFGSEGKNYFPIQIQDSTASATIQAQIGNPSNTKYLGSGQYKLKIRRYTSSGSSSSNDTQTPVDVQINYQTPSPEPTQAPTTQPTSAPTTAPTSSSTPKPSPTKSPTPKPTSTPIEEVEETSEPTTESIAFFETFTPTPTGLVAGVSTENKSKTIAFVFITTGVLLLGYCGYLIYNSKNVKVEKNS